MLDPNDYAASMDNFELVLNRSTLITIEQFAQPFWRDKTPIGKGYVVPRDDLPPEFFQVKIFGHDENCEIGFYVSRDEDCLIATAPRDMECVDSAQFNTLAEAMAYVSAYALDNVNTD